MDRCIKSLALGILFLSSTSYASYMPKMSGDSPRVKVLLQKDLTSIKVSGTDLLRTMNIDQQSTQYMGKKTVRFNCELSGKPLNAKNTILFASLSSPTGLISLDNEKYSGDLLIVADAKERGCHVVNDVPMESYISTLLSKEMHGKWEIEALKAQAVAARSYAFYKMKNADNRKSSGDDVFYDLESSEKDQVSGAFFDATEKTVAASRGTKGEILLTRDGELTPIFYHAECGGNTLRPEQVWGKAVKGYRSVACNIVPAKYRWSSNIGDEEWKSFLAWATKKESSSNISLREIQLARLVVVPDRLEAGKMRFYVGEKLLVLDKSLARKYFGVERFQSNSFRISDAGNSIEVSGRGRGHGVGMSQIGALRMAESGFNYQQILAHYYPGHKIKKVY